MFSLQHKTAIVTGGASGIGRAIASLFARQGAQVHIFELNEQLSLQAVSEIVSAGGTAVAHTLDITDLDRVRDAIKGISGHIDILVNNAGIAHIGTVETTTPVDFQKIVDVNIKGVYHCLQAVLPRMKAQRSGVILNMGSVASAVGLPDRFAYSMSKGAVHGMTLSVARDYVHDGIRCNSISPARVHTPFVDGFISRNYAGKEQEIFEKLSATQPIGRMGRPDEVASLALYLCSDEASFITGTDYPIDGGFIRLNT